jgi:TIR domain
VNGGLSIDEFTVKIFLSYASQDRSTAERIHYALRGSGHEVFFDEASLPPGADYNSRIRCAIAECDLFIYLISPHSIQTRRYVKSELQLAKMRWPSPWQYVLPVVISPTDTTLIDPYLTACTLLIPRGDVAAEVAAAASRFNRSWGESIEVNPAKAISPLHTTRVGVISPNILLNIDDVNKIEIDKAVQWPFEALAKKTSFLFDALFVSDNLDLTYEIIGSCSGEFDDDPTVNTLRFLNQKRFLVGPEDLGLPRVNDFVSHNPDSLTARLHQELLRIGNPGIEDFQKELLVGQPDVGSFAWHDGWHPRQEFVDKLGMTIEQQELLYENLLLRRNMAFLREAGYQDSVVAGQLYEHMADIPTTYIVWKIAIGELPQLSLDVPWKDILEFREEEQTQQFSRGLRRWVRKTVSEKLSAAEVEDEIRYLLGEYEKYVKIAGMKADRAGLSFLVPQNLNRENNEVEENFTRISDLAQIARSHELALLEAEMKAPGRELSLIPKLRERFAGTRGSEKKG